MSTEGRQRSRTPGVDDAHTHTNTEREKESAKSATAALLVMQQL